MTDRPSWAASAGISSEEWDEFAELHRANPERFSLEPADDIPPLDWAQALRARAKFLPRMLDQPEPPVTPSPPPAAIGARARVRAVIEHLTLIDDVLAKESSSDEQLKWAIAESDHIFFAGYLRGQRDKEITTEIARAIATCSAAPDANRARQLVAARYPEIAVKLSLSALQEAIESWGKGGRPARGRRTAWILVLQIARDVGLRPADPSSLKRYFTAKRAALKRSGWFSGELDGT